MSKSRPGNKKLPECNFLGVIVSKLTRLENHKKATIILSMLIKIVGWRYSRKQLQSLRVIIESQILKLH